MTGIDRLRGFARRMDELGVWPGGARLLDIADQIERETQPRSDHAADVSVSAYDLLPPDEREAIAWVREHGGLDEVEAHWSGRVPLTSVKRMVALHKAKRERLKAHALGLERKCAERGETIRELSDRAAKQSDEIRVMRDAIAETCARLGVEGTGSTVDDARVIWREISRRLMPEGMDWLVEAWPRFEDDAPLKFGDIALIDGEADMVEAVQLWIHGKPVIYGDGGSQQLERGERVNRPAPKVLDADGVEIRVGETVYLLPGDWCNEFPLLRCHEWDAMKALDLSPNHTTNRIVCETSATAMKCYPYPSQLTHRAPVLAADGRPLREGEHVYHVETGAELVVKELPKPGAYQAVVVFAPPASHLTSFDPDQLTHERPVADTWERLEDDATLAPLDYVDKYDIELYDREAGEDKIAAPYAMARDLVRRAKALAGVGE